MSTTTPHIPHLPQLAALATRMTEDEFVRVFPGQFLVTARIGDAARERTFATTLVPAYRAGSDRAVIAVVPIAKRPGVNPYGSMITVGRARNNDIVIDELSISKLHGWLRCHEEEGAEARLSITDAGSRNGTIVDGLPVIGEARMLSLGSRLRLGAVELWIADARLLHAALRESNANSRAA